MLYDAYEPDFDEFDEEIIQIYNQHYKVLFSYCDNRVSFTERETLTLDNYIAELESYMNNLSDIRLVLYELNETEEEYNSYLTQYKEVVSKINKIRNSSKKIRQRAERRYMKLTFKVDVNSIVEDAAQMLDQTIKYSESFKFHPDLFKSDTSQSDKTKAFFLTLIQATLIML